MIAYKLRSWVPHPPASMCAHLSRNPLAFDWLCQHPNHIEWGVVGDQSFLMKLLDSLTPEMGRELGPEVCYSIEFLEYFIPDVRDLSWEQVSANPHALPLIEANPDQINWRCLSRNPKALHLLESNPERIDWDYLCSNPGAIDLIASRPDKINWNAISSNPGVIPLLAERLGRTDLNEDIRYGLSWYGLALNPNAVELLASNPDKINWGILSCNPNALSLLKANLDSINWRVLSSNTGAVSLLRAHLDRIDWKILSSNLNAIELLESHPERIDWDELISNPGAGHLLQNGPVVWQDDLKAMRLWSNPAIFTYDYQRLKQFKSGLHERLIAHLYHPSRIAKFLKTHADVDEYLA